MLNGFSQLCLLALMSPAATRIDYNPDCEKALRGRGLVKRWQDDSGNLLLDEFSPHTLVVQIYNEGAPQPGAISLYPALTCLPQDDPQLIKIIREQYLVLPDNEPYNLSVGLSEFLSKPVPVPNEVDRLVFRGELKGGFFIEAGSNDAEHYSDSLHFEVNHSWKGLLVEPSPFHFRVGQTKHRKAVSINTCLATLPRPTIMPFDLSTASLSPGEAYLSIQCLPLYSILLALGNPTVNYFSLDVEGAEFPILKTIPWSQVDIQVISIETHFAGQVFPGTRENILEYMAHVGYHHVPHGHKNEEIVMYKGKPLRIFNDLFVREDLAAGIEVSRAREKEEQAGRR